MKSTLLVIYLLIDLGTFVYISFFDGYVYTWWNWIFTLPINAFLATIWPGYWLILRPFFGH